MSGTEPTLVLWADGRREIHDVIPHADYLTMPVMVGRSWADGYDMVEFLGEVFIHPPDWHGPHESHFMRDPETGAVYSFRYRQETP